MKALLPPRSDGVRYHPPRNEHTTRLFRRPGGTATRDTSDHELPSEGLSTASRQNASGESAFAPGISAV
jgi:hypothetical protein